MRTRRLWSSAAYVLAIVLAGGGTAADAAPLKVCKQICGQSIEVGCLGLRKRKLKKCRKRILKACKRDQTDCVVVTSTVATTSTTSTTSTTATLPPTSSTVVTTTTTTSTTTTTLDDIVFRGRWNVHPTIVSDGCALGETDDVLEIHGTAAQATGTLDVAPLGAPLTGQVDDTGSLLLGIELTDGQGCVTELQMRLLGPIDLSDTTTTGDATLERRGCSEPPDCVTTFSCSFER
jgi:hypothetical protein